MTDDSNSAPAVDIAGAGPAGLAAAIALAAAGRRAVVHERASDVAHRFHGDIQGLENWTSDVDVIEELATIGVAPTFEYTPFRETVLFEADGREHVYRSERPFYYGIRRGARAGTLDDALKRQALDRGVELRFRDPVDRLPDGGIVAFGPRGADVIAVGYVFETDASNGAYVVFSPALAPLGYAYLLVANGHGTVASCMFSEFEREREFLERTVDFFRRHVGVAMQNERRFGGTGNFRPFRPMQRGRMLFVGEAAGFQDPLWGFGLRYAMVSGQLAAAALMADEPERYEALVRRRFGTLFRAGLVNRYVFNQWGRRAYRALIRRLDRAPDPRRSLTRQYEEPFAKRLLYPLAARAGRWPRDPAPCADAHCDRIWCRGEHRAAEDSGRARAPIRER